MDKNRNGSLDYQEFKRGLQDYRICQDEREIRAVFNHFDVDRNGSISYNEFIRTIVGEMNARRKALCEAAFKKLDAAGTQNGLIELDDVKRLYNAKQHPDVVSFRKSEDEVLCDFLDTFEHQFVERFGSKHSDRKITLPEWLEYYNNVSCNIELDETFEEMIVRCYNL